MKVTKNILRPGIFILAAFVLRVGYADELALCSEHGNANLPVTSRVDAISAGQVSAGKQILLRNEPADTCKGGANCSVYGAPPLRAGTAGVELGRNQAWVCVGVAGIRPLDVWYGWIPTGRWERRADEQKSARSWRGVWQNGNAKITIRTIDGANLDVTGNALWVGGAPGNAHFGNFQAAGIPANGVISTKGGAEATACQVALRIVDKFLFAADNQQCGGMNVTFDGVYRFRLR